MAIPTSTATNDSLTNDAIARLPRNLAFRYDVMPLAIRNGVLTVAVPNVADGEFTRRFAPCDTFKN